ncbi:MAG: ArsR family transcriptional regulator [archaeon]|nr:ArsR family transcriptional regulator [archaeon]
MPERVVQIAPVGDNLDALFVGLREFPTKKIVLLAPTDKMADARELEKRLAPFKLPVTIIELKGSSILEKMFEVVAGLKKEESFSRENVDPKGEDNVIVNVATGDRISTCAALSASYVNGIRAFSVVEDHVMLLPMLKFSFNKLISDKKMEIIKALADVESRSFEELAKRLKMSAPLLSYHLNGDRETSGLIELGLVEWVGSSYSASGDREKNNGGSSSNSKETGKRAKLTSMGVLFFRGYCQ